MTDMEATSPLLTSQELAKYLGLTEATIRNWQWAGQGPPFVRLGNKVIRYRREDVEKWLTEKAQAGS